MYFELIARGYKVENQKQIKVYFKKQLIGDYFAYLLLEDKVIVELKACELLMNVYVAQNNELSKSNRNRSGFIIEFWRRTGV
jgi:GxxExxY protein